MKTHKVLKFRFKLPKKEIQDQKFIPVLTFHMDSNVQLFDDGSDVKSRLRQEKTKISVYAKS